MMTPARYFIVHNETEGQWLIRYEDQEFGPYKSHDEARLFAIDAAQKLESYGKAAEVCLMGENGHYHAEWVSGQGAERRG
jgi:hypothetical protein